MFSSGCRRGILTLASGGAAQPPTANMVAWFRKGLGITASASAVSNWADQTGLGGRDLAQATGAAQPTLQADGTILFNGSSHQLRTATFTLPQPCTIYLRFKPVTWISPVNIYDGFTLNSGALVANGVDGAYDIAAGSASGGASTSGTSGTWSSSAVSFNDVLSTFQFNADAPSTIGSPGTASPSGFTLGCRPNGAGDLFSNIQVAEVIIYNVQHDASTRLAVIAYLNTK